MRFITYSPVKQAIILTAFLLTNATIISLIAILDLALIIPVKLHETKNYNSPKLVELWQLI